MYFPYIFNVEKKRSHTWIVFTASSTPVGNGNDDETVENKDSRGEARVGSEDSRRSYKGI